MQGKLLRVLQEKEVRPVGSNQSVNVDFRIIAATNQDLATAVKEQRFREDLYFRLRVVPITLPPLRQRRDDIPELISYFIDKINREMGTSVAGVSPAAQALLIQHSWPGNVRELENTLLRAAVLAPGRMLTPADLSLPAAASVLLEDFADLSFEEVVRRKLKAYFQQTALLEPCDLHAIVIGQVEKPLIQALHDAGVHEGIGGSSVSSHGFGESQPVATNDTTTGRQQNRRVELVVSGDVIGTSSEK